MSCMKLYEQADQARAAGNTAEAERLSAMAAQQCMQAAENAKNAGQNQEGADQITAPNMAAAQQNTSEAAIPTVEKPETLSAPLTGDPLDPEPEAQIAAEESTAPPSAFETQPPTSLSGESVASTVNGVKSLPQIKSGALGFDESAENNPAALDGAGGNGFLGGSAAAGSKLTSNALFDSIAGSKSEGSESEASHRRKRSVEASGEESGSEGTESEGGGSSFRSMFAGLMGGAQEAATPSAFASGALLDQTVARPSANAPNIFEFANYRYRKIHREGELGKSVKRSLASRK
jgi:hypothetical protein